MAKQEKDKLKKELGLLDVFALSTGAMFSSGFFLLPGLAYANTGPSVVLAYFLAAVFILPAMFSMAELATALPRAGGDYYFLDRSLGPGLGTIGGLGSYFALLLKTTFALVGIGAYLGIFYDIPVKWVAISVTLLLMGINILGAKQSSGFQKVFVAILLSVMVFYLIQGFGYISDNLGWKQVDKQFSPFAPFGIESIFATVGFVFVSYAGLTKIASIAEEIKQPERNIPWSMILSVIVVSTIYVLGVFVMVTVLDHESLKSDLTPVATSGDSFFHWLPRPIGLIIVVSAAIIAFISMGNAGLMAASRYPLAMSRDRLLPPFLNKLNKFQTPYVSILISSAIIIFFIAALNVKNIAKLASTLQLFIFIMINFSVIIMRSSRIESYDPGFRSPFYPWMQLAGIFVALALIIYLGWLSILFSTGMVIVAFAWYRNYGRKRVKREGAIYHWFALLGKNQYSGLENEFLSVLKEKGLREGDPFDQMVVESKITHQGNKKINYSTLLSEISRKFSQELKLDKGELNKEFKKVTSIDPALIIPRVSILYARLPGIENPRLHIVINKKGINKPVVKGEIASDDDIQVFFFMVGPNDQPRQQLRMLSRVMDIVERENFVEKIINTGNHREIKEYLLHNDRFISLQLLSGIPQAELIDKKLMEIKLPQDVLVALLQRGDNIFTPRGNTRLKENDIITIIGEPRSIKQLFDKYIRGKKVEL
jgi:amino acid transporter/mannitol/fructose-specific phosphotransferase system IIA component (Ntr-type)